MSRASSMSSEFDIVVRGGTVVDGTGAPPFVADVALSGRKIVKVGTVVERGATEIDARGKLVTPGFVDIHTHYDAQAVWDSRLAPSSWHGVTTVVMGNCGVGFAPCRPADREKLVELMEGVEDIPGAVMHEGLVWEWESFAEYLGTVERKPHDVDIAALLPHAALRVYVMGDRAARLEDANAQDIAEMRRVACEAIHAGAFGFSTSRLSAHKNLRGEFTPTLRAREDELTGIAMGLADAGKGFMELVAEWNQPNPREEFAMLRRIAERSGRPILFSLVQRDSELNAWKELLTFADAAINEGLSIRPVVAARAIGVLFGLEFTQNPFTATPTYKSIAELPLEERVKRMRDPATRQKILSEDPRRDSVFPIMNRLSYERMFRFGNPPEYEPKREDSIAAMARREGRTAPEIAYDALLEDGGQGLLYLAVANYANFDLSASEEMLAYPHSIMGLGDGGAHVGFILDAGFPTWMITHWNKKRQRFDLPETIRRITSDPANAVGLNDRGVIAVGKKADLNVIDYDRIDFGRPYIAQDLPAGGKRLMQKAMGYCATIVSGRVTYLDGEATGELPGRLVRGPQSQLA